MILQSAICTGGGCPIISRGLLTFYVRSVRGLLAIARPYGPPYNSSSFVFLSAESLLLDVGSPGFLYENRDLGRGNGLFNFITDSE